jgi:hypothetical protein
LVSATVIGAGETVDFQGITGFLMGLKPDITPYICISSDS